MGFLIFVGGILRITWAISRWCRKAPMNGVKKSYAARAGHGLLYTGSIIVPYIALLRAYGSGRGFSFMGLPVIEGAPQKVETLIAFGNALHSEMGIALFVLIAGHVGLAIYHFVERSAVQGLPKTTRSPSS